MMANIFANGRDERPRIDKIAAKQTLRLGAESPEPFETDSLKGPWRPFLGADEKVEAGARAKDIAIPQCLPVLIDPDFGLRRANAEKEMCGRVGANPHGQIGRIGSIVLESAGRHIIIDGRAVKAMRQEPVHQEQSRFV